MNSNLTTTVIPHGTDLHDQPRECAWRHKPLPATHSAWAILLVTVAVAVGPRAEGVPISNYGDLLVSTYYAQGIYRFSSDGTAQGLFASEALSGRTQELAVSPDGRFFYTDHMDSSLRTAIGRYDVRTGQYLGDVITAGTLSHFGGALEVGRDGTIFVSGNNDHSGRVGSITAYKNGTATVIDNSINDPWSLALSPDGNHLYVSSWSDSGVYEYRLINGTWTKVGMVFSVPSPEGLALNSDGTRLFVASAYSPSPAYTEYNTVQEFDLSSHSTSPLHTYTGGGLSGARYVVVGPSGNDIYVSSCNSGQVIRYDLTSHAGSPFLRSSLGNETAFGLAFVPAPASVPDYGSTLSYFALALVSLAPGFLRRR